MNFAKNRWMYAERMQPVWLEYREEEKATIGAFFRAGEPNRVAAVVACQGPNRSIYRFWSL